MRSTEWKCLQPEKLSIDPNTVSAEDDWKFWFKTITNFIEAMPTDDNAFDKLKVLTAYLTAPVYKLISEKTAYDDAIAALRNLYVKPKNEIYSRHMLATARQTISESVDEFVLRINKLSQDCNFASVSAQQYKDDMKKDSFINGIASSFIRQRLLENRTLTFTEAYEKARSLELASLNSEAYTSRETTPESLCVVKNEETSSAPNEACTSTLGKQNIFAINSGKAIRKFVCYFCGSNKWHPSTQCSARNENCNFCGKLGHYAKCCLKRKDSSNCVGPPSLATTTALQSTFSKHVLADIIVNNKTAQALIDTGSTNSYINEEFLNKHDLCYKSLNYVANMANVTLQTEIIGVCFLNLTFMENQYKNFKFFVMPNLIADSIIGDDLLQQHKSVTFNFDGKRPELNVSATMPTACVPFPDLFINLAPNCKPIAVKTRNFSASDQAVIKAQTERLLLEDRIEKSKSSSRAQPLVVNNGKGKQRMCIDYSQTINLFTDLEAYPLPSIDAIVNEVAKWKCISTLDLKSAYDQIKIRPDDRPFTAFQSGSELYQWKVMPFGLTNAVPAFQRVMNEFIER